MAIKIFSPDPKTGVIKATPPRMQAGGPITPFSQRSGALDTINRLMSGGKPDICVIRSQGGIGDVLMTLPTVKAIKKKYGGKVDYATDFRYLGGSLAQVLEGNPYIDNVLDWHSLPRENYSAIIDLTCPCIAHEQPKAPPINRIDLFAQHAGVELKSRDIDYVVRPEEEAWAEEYLRKLRIWSMEVILVQPFSSSLKRNLPKPVLEKAIAEILKQRSKARIIVLTHDTDDKKTSWRYMKIKQAHNLSVRQIAALSKKVNLVMCQDSSVLHIAGALSAPTVSFFGPTDPRARVNHYKNSAAIWPGKKLGCCPSWYSKPRCGDTCWQLVTPEMISTTAISMLSSGRPPEEDWITYGDPTPITPGRVDPRFEVI